MGMLAWRRLLPFLATVVGFSAGLLAAAAGVPQHEPFSPLLGALIGLYSLGLYATPPRALVGFLYAVGCLELDFALGIHHGESFGGTDFGWATALLLAPWLVGKARAWNRRRRSNWGSTLARGFPGTARKSGAGEGAVVRSC